MYLFFTTSLSHKCFWSSSASSLFKPQSQQKLSAFIVCWKFLEASWSNSVDPDQTAPIGAVWSGSTLFAFLLKFIKNVSKSMQQMTKQMTFSDAFFSGALRVNNLDFNSWRFACWAFLHACLLLIFLITPFSKNSFMNTMELSNILEPDQAQCFVGHDLGPNCL